MNLSQPNSTRNSEGFQKIGGVSEIEEIIEGVMVELTDISVPLPVLTGETEGGCRNHEIMCHTFSWNVISYVGECPRISFEDQVRSAVYHTNQKYMEYGGDWQPVAWSITTGRGLARNLREREEVEAWDKFREVRPGQGPYKPQSREVYDFTVEQRYLTVAYADIQGSEPYCPLFEENGKKSGSMYRYAETGGNLRYVPRHVRKERERGIELIKKYYAFHNLHIVDVAEPPAPKSGKIPCEYCDKEFTPRGLPRHIVRCPKAPGTNRFAAPQGDA